MVEMFNNLDNPLEKNGYLQEFTQETNNLKKEIERGKTLYKRGNLIGGGGRVETNINMFQERLKGVPDNLKDAAEKILMENPIFTNKVRSDYERILETKKLTGKYNVKIPNFYSFFCTSKRAKDNNINDEDPGIKVSQGEVLSKSKEFEKLMENKYKENPKFTNDVNRFYNNIRGEKPSKEAFFLAYKGYEKLKENAEINNEVLTIVDYSKGSRNHGNLYMINMKTGHNVLYTTAVQGMGGGKTSGGKLGFSNEDKSFQSSLGFCVVNDPVIKPSKTVGEHVVLTGVEPNINDNMVYRNMYAHGGQKSKGCIVVPKGKRQEFLNNLIGRNPAQEVKDGKTYQGTKKGVIFSYAPSVEYLKKSSIV